MALWFFFFCFIAHYQPAVTSQLWAYHLINRELSHFKALWGALKRGCLSSVRRGFITVPQHLSEMMVWVIEGQTERGHPPALSVTERQSDGKDRQGLSSTDLCKTINEAPPLRSGDFSVIFSTTWSLDLFIVAGHLISFSQSECLFSLTAN